jgi:hypothetical protein
MKIYSVKFTILETNGTRSAEENLRAVLCSSGLWHLAVWKMGTNKIGLFPEDGGSIFLSNLGTHLPGYIIS